MDNQIIYIKTEKLQAHPHNPRKDLGDLTELAESIRIKGVMQNLTVVPMESGICLSCKNYDPRAASLCSRNDTDKERKPCTKWEGHGLYTIVIGHRRAAAAKLAGVEAVPCIVSSMSPYEQIETMLLENMQRTDLTVIEQAKGFQMMLDFGESIATISQKTGFSESTVRRRVKLTELDQKKLEKAVERGGSLMDYLELEKIEDPALKDRVLDAIGTNNFRNELKSALDEEGLKCRMAQWERDIAEFADKIKERDYIGETYFRMDYEKNFCRWTKKSDIVERPKDTDSVKYFYRVGINEIDLYREHTDREKTAEEIQEEKTRSEVESRRKALQTISTQHHELRSEFIRDFSDAKKNRDVVFQFAVLALIGEGYYQRQCISSEAIKTFFGIITGKNVEYEKLLPLINEKLAQKAEYTLLAIAYGTIDRGNETYFDFSWNSEKRRSIVSHKPNAKLDRIYSLLKSLGYEMSDEERAMQDGTHKLFQELEGSVNAEQN